MGCWLPALVGWELNLLWKFAMELATPAFVTQRQFEVLSQFQSASVGDKAMSGESCLIRWLQTLQCIFLAVQLGLVARWYSRPP